MRTEPTVPERVNLFGPDFRANAYRVYARLQEDAPFYARPSGDSRSRVWFVTRYADVEAILRDHKRFVKDYRNCLTAAERRALPPEPPLLRLLSNHMLNLDEPDHTRLRALVNKAFTLRMVEQLEERIQTIADQLLDRVADRGRMDLIEQYALPLPIIVIAEMLGIPPADRNRFQRWSRALVAPSPNMARNTKKIEKARGVMEDFTAYLREIFAQRRIQPRDDLISELLTANVQGDAAGQAWSTGGDMLSEDELFSMILLLVVVGYETTVNLIGNGLLALLQHPHWLDRVRREPALLPAVVEEILRYDCPVERAPMRFAAEDVDVGGVQIRRGDSVSLVLGAANRDPAQFHCPDQFDPERSANRHLGFGLGVHYCLGAPLARVEGRIALGTLLQRLPDLRLAVSVPDLKWQTNPIMRGLRRLPVEWGTSE